MGTIFITGYNVISSIFRGLGNSKTPLVFVAVACAINVILDFVLVKYFHMGAKGAAIATVMAQAGSLLFSLLYIKRRGIGMQFTKTHIRWDGKAIKKITKVGAPIALQETLVSLSFLIITVIINTRGLVASAAVGVVEKLISFLMIPAFSMGAAVAAMVAQNYGATKLDRAKKCMWSGVEVSLAFAVVISVICWFRGDIFTSIFSNDSQVVAQAALYLKTYGLDCILVSFVFNMNGYFNGCGKSLFTMVHSLATTFCIRVPVTMLLNAMAGATLTTIGCAAPLSTLGSLILCLCYLYYLKRQLAKDKRNAFHA